MRTSGHISGMAVSGKYGVDHVAEDHQWGQTGVDRAGLDVALALGLEVGGWCPKGRRAEDGPIPDRYPLVETPKTDYDTRTRRNVEDSDGTLVLNRGPLEGGTALTVDLARKIGKPCLIVALEEGIDPATFQTWLMENAIQVLIPFLDKFYDSEL